MDAENKVGSFDVWRKKNLFVQPIVWLSQSALGPTVRDFVKANIAADENCLDALRIGNPPDKHCKQFSSVEIEMADVVIRVFEYAQYKELRIGEAIISKQRFNETRPHKNGGKKF